MHPHGVALLLVFVFVGSASAFSRSFVFTHCDGVPCNDQTAADGCSLPEGWIRSQHSGTPEAFWIPKHVDGTIAGLELDCDVVADKICSPPFSVANASLRFEYKNPDGRPLRVLIRNAADTIGTAWATQLDDISDGWHQVELQKVDLIDQRFAFAVAPQEPSGIVQIKAVELFFDAEIGDGDGDGDGDEPAVPCTQYLCPNLQCVKREQNCPACPSGQKQCWDGNCIPNANPCPLAPIQQSVISASTVVAQSSVEDTELVLLRADTADEAGRVVVAPGTFATDATVSAEPVSPQEAFDLLGDSFTARVFSPLVGLTAEDTVKRAPVELLQPVAIQLLVTLPNDVSIEDDLRLHFIDEEARVWVPLNETMELISEYVTPNTYLMRGYAPHFTTFGVLLPSKGDGGDGGSDDDQTTLIVVVLVCVLVPVALIAAVAAGVGVYVVHRMRTKEVYTSEIKGRFEQI